MKAWAVVTQTALVMAMMTGLCAAQSSRVSWSSFAMGYNGPVAGNTIVRSAVGQNFAGLARHSDTQVLSGFLAGIPVGTVVSVDDDDDVPLRYQLAQNYPNPFNPTTTIRFEIPAEVHVALKVYNVLGQEVLVVVDEVKQPGRYDVRVEASALASGPYFYRLRAGDFVETRKFVLLR
jgi:hypothetical protein